MNSSQQEQLRAAIIDVLNTHNDEEEADAIIDRLDLNKDGFVDVNDLRFLQKMEPNEMQDFIQSFTARGRSFLNRRKNNDLTLYCTKVRALVYKIYALYEELYTK